jgi:hypothetical protein
MSTSLQSLFVAALLGGATLACSKSDPPAPVSPAPEASALPDLANPQTWDRKDRPFVAKGRARIGIRTRPGPEKDKRCEPRPQCKCLTNFLLTLEGPRNGDRVWIDRTDTPEADVEHVVGCTGEGRYPQGEVEVEGTLTEGFFWLSKPPKYLDASKAPSSGKTQ